MQNCLRSKHLFLHEKNNWQNYMWVSLNSSYVHTLVYFVKTLQNDLWTRKSANPLWPAACRFFTMFSTAVYNQEWLLLQTFYVLNKENILQNPLFIIKFMVSIFVITHIRNMRVHYPVAKITLLSMKCFEKAIKRPFCAVPDCLSCLCPKLQVANCTFNQSPCYF